MDTKTEELKAAHDVLAEFYAERLAGALDRVAWHRHRTPPVWTAQVLPGRTAQRAVQARTAPQRALPLPIHLHLHGPVSAADVAELIQRQQLPAADDAQPR